MGSFGRWRAVGWRNPCVPLGETNARANVFGAVLRQASKFVLARQSRHYYCFVDPKLICSRRSARTALRTCFFLMSTFGQRLSTFVKPLYCKHQIGCYLHG